MQDCIIVGYPGLVRYTVGNAIPMQANILDLAESKLPSSIYGAACWVEINCVEEGKGQMQ